MNRNYSNLKIALNFLPLDKHDFSFSVYTKCYELPKNKSTNTKEEDIRKYPLPSDTAQQPLWYRGRVNIRKDSSPSTAEFTENKYSDYQISLESKRGFVQKNVASFTNYYLTQYVLFSYLCKKCAKVLKSNQFFIEQNFHNRVNFIMAETNIGNETIWLEPYFLHKTQEFGFLLGFHFRVKGDQKLNKDVLQKSLSLGPDGRENVNYYVDNYQKLEEFMKRFYSQIFPLDIKDDVKIELVWPPREIEADFLNTKSYMFANENHDVSQFQGIKKYGPLQSVQDNSLICFMYPPKEKLLSYELYHALRGEKYATFPGMETMFSFSLDKEHVMGVPLYGYDDSSINAAVEQIYTFAQNKPVLPVLLFPWTRLDPDQKGIDTYYKIKHRFLAKKMPTQFVSLKRIRDRDGLKWSISNIGLAIFSKLGGKPWKLATNHERCLIIGIGQAHRREGKNISRYFAYSVLSDSSGLYDSIRILSKSEDKEQYLNGLTEKIKSVINESSKQYKRFVIHTPFKLKRDEMQAIQKALEGVKNESREKIFVVLKFNDNSKYFGFALNNNSKVPYESSYISLGKKQYLIWFEGLQYHNPTIRRRIARPMHIEFVYTNNELTYDDEKSYLQDAINLSGANWRGFNAKTLPVSVYYAKLIAVYIREFDRLRLPEIDIENLPPWFL